MADKQTSSSSGTVRNLKVEDDKRKEHEKALALQHGRMMANNQRQPLYKGPQMTPGNRRASTTRRSGY